MNNLKNNIWNKRIHPFIGVLFLIFSLGTIGFLSSNAILFGTKAATDNTPKNVKISNISDSSFTVSYFTDSNTTGSISYGETQTPDKVALDDRDKETSAEHFVHYVTVKNLKPSTKYFLTITSGAKTFLNKDVPYETTTTDEFQTFLPEEFLLKGKVTLEDGSIPTEAIAYVSSKSSENLAALINTKGEYNIDISSLPDVSSDTVLDLQIFDPTRQSKISLLVDQADPAPLIILSKDYNFSVSSEPISSSPQASASGTITPVAFPAPDDKTKKVTSPQIISPETDQEFKDQQPLFTGKAVPNSTVEITIESENPIKTTVKSSASGNWQYRPDTKLAPGNHTVTIKTTDSSGIIRTITQSFVVFAEGSKFTEPSISPSVNPTKTPTPTSAPVTIVASPTKTLTPTPTTVAKATAKPTTPQATIPVTGNTNLTTTVIGIISAVGVGALLFFLTAL